jgi:hypothetical protein
MNYDAVYSEQLLKNVHSDPEYTGDISSGNEAICGQE